MLIKQMRVSVVGASDIVRNVLLCLIAGTWLKAAFDLDIDIISYFQESTGKVKNRVLVPE